jgi:hypothetical protein
MPTALADTPAQAVTAPTTHIVCCTPTQALCGHTVTGQPVPDGVGHDCRICLHLEAQACTHCGAPAA